MTAPQSTAQVPGRHLTFESLAHRDWEIPKFMWEPEHDGRPVGTCPIGSLSFAAGRPGAGKSSFGRYLAAQITRGTLPGAYYGKAAKVVYIAGEENITYNVIPGLLAAGADMTKVIRPRVDFITPDGEIEEVAILPEKDMRTIADQCRMNGVKLVIVDPIMQYMGAADVHRNNEVRDKLRPWTRLAEEIDGAVIAIVHLNKSGNGDVVAGINGSSAFGEVARCVIAFTKQPDSDDRIMSVEKNSIGEEGAAWTYRIVGREITRADGLTHEFGAFQLGEIADQTVGEVLRDQGAGESTGDAKEVVLSFLRESGGTAPAAEVCEEVKAAGHNWGTVKNKRRRWGIETKKIGDSWHWTLKGNNTTSPSKPKQGNNTQQKGQHTNDLVTLLSSQVDRQKQDNATREDHKITRSQVSWGTASNPLPDKDMREIESLIVGALSIDFGLSESTVLGTVPTKLAPRETVKSVLDALVESGAIALDSRGRYLKVNQGVA